MIPNDLAGFSVEQLRGFATAVRDAADTLGADLKAFDASPPDPADAEAVAAANALKAGKVQELNHLLNERDRLNAAIETALAEVEADATLAGLIENAPADDDDDATDAVDETPDAEAVLEEAVATASFGGGTAPRVKSESADSADVEGTRRFLRGMEMGASHSEERHHFTTMKRETNHIVRAGQNANDAIKAAVLSRAAGEDKTAAACFCGPDQVIDGIRECCESIRPLSDTLPTLTASGDVRYVRGVDLADALTGITEWTCVDQDGVDPEVVATWKPCFELECPPEITSCMYAISACATFNTQQMIGNPELIANLENVMQCAFSKTAELLLYNRLRSLSSRYSFGYALTGYGASAQLLAAVGWAMEAIRANLRVANPNYTLALPAGLLERVLADGVIRGMDEYRTRDDLFDRLSTLGVTNVVELVDEIVCTPGGPLAHAPLVDPGTPTCPVTVDCTRTAAPQHPVNQEIILYRPEDFLLGVGPDIDLGIVRSPELARQNKLQWFTEGFEFLEKIGCGPAIDLVVPFCASGIRPALGTGEDCTP